MLPLMQTYSEKFTSLVFMVRLWETEICVEFLSLYRISALFCIKKSVLLYGVKIVISQSIAFIFSQPFYTYKIYFCAKFHQSYYIYVELRSNYVSFLCLLTALQTICENSSIFVVLKVKKKKTL